MEFENHHDFDNMSDMGLASYGCTQSLFSETDDTLADIIKTIDHGLTGTMKSLQPDDALDSIDNTMNMASRAITYRETVSAAMHILTTSGNIPPPRDSEGHLLTVDGWKSPPEIAMTTHCSVRSELQHFSKCPRRPNPICSA